jgi:UDP-N-acetylmuramoylalanine--D-glutamate ligase
MGLSLEGSQIVIRSYGDEKRVLGNLEGVRTLRGLHNTQNACFAAGVADILELWNYERDDGERYNELINAAFRSFPGLPHRMEEVGERGATLFINDSKATNADSTEKALASFDSILWILGGKAKEGGITSLKPYFPKIEKAYLIGAASDAFAATLEGHVPYVRCGTLDKAVEAAAQDARAIEAREPVVLLSPACASYDQYTNFEVRGDHFRALVRALPGVTAKGA